MANTIYRGSDTVATQVMATTAFPSTLAATGWIEVRGFTHVEFQIILSSGQSVTDLTAHVEYKVDADSNAPAYTLTVESLDTTATPVVANQHKYAVVAAGAFAGSAGLYALPVPVHGRYMRLQLKGGPSVGSDQVTVKAYRRTT
jgi:hypothetical protein